MECQKAKNTKNEKMLNKNKKIPKLQEARFANDIRKLKKNPEKTKLAMKLKKIRKPKRHKT